MTIITEKLVYQAIAQIRIQVQKMLREEGRTWGPKYVKGILKAPGLKGIVRFEFGAFQPWNPKWGKEEINFYSIAWAKLGLAAREKMNTSDIIKTRPWVLRKGDYFYAGGVYHVGGIVVGVSGANATTDEAIAIMLADAIADLALQEAQRRISAGECQI